MEDLSVRRYATLEFVVEADDETAQTVEFTAFKDNTVYLTVISTFVDGEANVKVEEVDIPLGEYEYTLTVRYSDDVTEIYPDPDECDDECELPTLTVCKSNPSEIVS